MAAAAPITPVESDVHILSAIFELDPALRDGALREGLSFNEGAECAVVGSWPSGCAPLLDPDDDDTWKTVSQIGDVVTFKPFMAYLFVECPDGYLTQQIDDRRSAQLRKSFDVVKHVALAKQLWYGDADASSSPTLRSAASVVSATAAPLVKAVAALLAAHKSLAPGPVFIHGPWILVPHLQSAGILYKVNGRYEGLGFVYVVDEGYPAATFAGPQATAGPPPTYTADVAGTAWLYATGRIEYTWGRYIDNPALGIDSPNEGSLSPYTVWDARTNRSLIRIEQAAFLRFDPCSVMAQRVTIP